MGMNIVFIGLGKMGAPMARHLHTAGHQVLGVDPAPRAMPFRVVPRLHDALAGEPAVLVSSLPDDAALLAVAAALPARAGLLYVDTSTVSLDASRQAAAHCATQGLAYLRAPVSGNAAMAEAAQLTVLASGDEAAFERCEPLFDTWGPRCLYLGFGDEARVAKLVLNLMVAGASGLLAEALAMGQRAGLPWADLWRVIEHSAVASPLLLAKAPALRQRDYTPTFTVQQMQKDLGLILDAATACGLQAPMARSVNEALARAADAGDAALDYAVVIRDAERRAGLNSQPTEGVSEP